MRLTINLKPEVYALAKSLAREEDCSISMAVNRLIQRGLSSGTPETHSLTPRVLNGFSVAQGHRAFSGDLIKELEAKDDL